MGEKMIYTNVYAKEIEFSMQSPFKLTGISGFSENNVLITESSSVEQIGASCSSLKIQPKDITIDGEYEYKEELRRKLLSTVIPGVKGILRWITKTKDVYIEVTPSKTPTISEDAVVQDFQIVLRASYPLWRETDMTSVQFNYYTSLFKFPCAFSNKTPWKISKHNLNVITNVFNSGDIQTGFTIIFVAIEDVVSPELLNIRTREIIKMRKDFTLKRGEELIVSTIRTKKTVTLKKNGIGSNAFKYLDTSTTFFQLDVGDNVVRYGADLNYEGLSCTLSFETTYAGI